MSAAEALFDRGAEYDALLERGLRLTGEGKEYFMRGRLRLLDELLPLDFAPRQILDFGCGIGDTTAALAARFPEAAVTGVDTATRAVEYARERHGGERVRFRALSELDRRGAYDLCYVNGVFHHIPPGQRSEALAMVRDALGPDALFALFENNPWNPGTRLVMARIPFDRDAQTIDPRAAVVLLRRNGFAPLGRPRHLFFFPAPLAALRGMERYLRGLPLGGQYLVVARPVRAAAPLGGSST